MQKCLVIGGGAVGQVYAHALEKAGVDVTFYVREKYAETMRKGIRLYPAPMKPGQERGLMFNHYSVISTRAEVEKIFWDQIWLCVPSNALQEGSFQELLKCMRGHVIINLLPGFKDYKEVASLVGPTPVIQGVIPFLSYAVPYEGGEPCEPGFAFWHPRGSTTSLSGHAIYTKEVAKLLKKGGLSAKAGESAFQSIALGTAFLMPFLRALEEEGWSFNRLRKSKRLELALEAMREGFEIIERTEKITLPWWSKYIKKSLVSFLLKVAPKLTPLDLEGFFKRHFTKVKNQTLSALATFIESGKEANLPVEQLERLFKGPNPEGAH